MPASRLTDAVIQKLRANGGDVLRKDGGAPGLYLRVRAANQRKTWVLRLKRFDATKGARKTNVVTLGDWPSLGLAQARVAPALLRTRLRETIRSCTEGSSDQSVRVVGVVGGLVWLVRSSAANRSICSRSLNVRNCSICRENSRSSVH